MARSETLDIDGLPVMLLNIVSNETILVASMRSLLCRCSVEFTLCESSQRNHSHYLSSKRVRKTDWTYLAVI